MSWYLFVKEQSRDRDASRFERSRKPLSALKSKNHHHHDATGGGGGGGGGSGVPVRKEKCSDMLTYGFVMIVSLIIFPLTIYYTNSRWVMLAYLIWLGFILVMKFIICKIWRKGARPPAAKQGSVEADAEAVVSPGDQGHDVPLINEDPKSKSRSAGYIDLKIEPPLQQSTPKSRSFAEYHMAMEMPYADMDETKVVVCPPSPHNYKVTST